MDSKDTVRGVTKKFGVSKNTVRMVVTIRNGLKDEVNSGVEGWFMV